MLKNESTETPGVNKVKNVASSRHTDINEIAFSFVCECEDCGAEGELVLQVKDGMKPFNCPEGCGAVYVPWKNPMNFNRWELMAVVMPVFDRGAKR